ncbi:unnamed protein product [Protopolystoma xenopodis]|uniref:Uncharacterized protein n=1 Tax=Protopolystoma xenopodis TaxID=117903 RepID=A0A3S5BK79_9PLAT|nr:unnamed protein product [Protopolystoma xenopodis]
MYVYYKLTFCFISFYIAGADRRIQIMRAAAHKQEEELTRRKQAQTNLKLATARMSDWLDDIEELISTDVLPKQNNTSEQLSSKVRRRIVNLFEVKSSMSFRPANGNRRLQWKIIIYGFTFDHISSN